MNPRHDRDSESAVWHWRQSCGSTAAQELQSASIA